MLKQHEIERAWDLWEMLVELENFIMDVYYEDFMSLERKLANPCSGKSQLDCFFATKFKVSGETESGNPGEEPGKG